MRNTTTIPTPTTTTTTPRVYKTKGAATKAARKAGGAYTLAQQPCGGWCYTTTTTIPTTPTAQFAQQYSALRGAGSSKCAALRTIAGTWEHTRKAFIAGAGAQGVNPYTASTQWQLGRAG